MKILLIKTEDNNTLEIKAKHLEKIRAVNKNMKITVVSVLDKQKIEKRIKDTEIMGGVPGVFPSIKNARNLKWIQSFSAGVEKVLTPEIIKSKVIVTNVSGIHVVPISEHVLGIMLIFTRRFYDSFVNQQNKKWKANQDLTELRDKTVLVVGLGHIGVEVSRLAKCFGAKVIAVKQNVKNKPVFVDKLYSKEQLGRALPKSDFVVLCLPLTPKTHRLFDLKKLKLMKKTAILINIGRGEVLNEIELIYALDKKIIKGAALDVTEEEPLPKKSPLWNMKNVVITPHHSGMSEKYMDRAIDVFCLNLKAYLKGKPLPNLVDKKRGY